MTWNTLILWLSGVYLLYYLLNMAYDLARAPKLKTTVQDQVLTFTEPHQPELIGPGGEPVKVPVVPAKPAASVLKTEKAFPASGIGFTGSVSLAEMFSLFKADALQATKAIPY